jgi:hypothetical protein
MLRKSIDKSIRGKKTEIDAEVQEIQNSEPYYFNSLLKQDEVVNSGGKTKATPESKSRVKDFGVKLQGKDNELRDYIKVQQDFLWETEAAITLDRYSRLKGLYEIDFLHLFEKVKALELGLNIVYRLTSKVKSVPISDSNISYLDDLYLWIKSQLRELTLLLQMETETIFIVGTRAGVLRLGDKNLPIYADDPKWVADLESGLFRFTLPAELFSGMDYVRLRDLAVSVYTKQVEVKDTLAFQGRITLPVQKRDAGNPMLLPSIRQTIPMVSRDPSFDFCSAQWLINVNPLAGEWTIEISDFGLTGETRKGQIEDLYLVLRVAYLEKGPA